MQIKGVIFDLDGTLLESEEIQWEVWRNAGRFFGISLSKEDYMHFAGDFGIKVAKDIVEKKGVKASPEEFLRRKREMTAGFLEKSDIKFMPYAKEAIEFFIKRGIKTAIATNTSRNNAEIKVRKAKIDTEKIALVAATDVGSRGKPEPDIYLEAAKRLGLSPGECIAFEDTDSGLWSAKSAGMICFVVPTKFTKDHDFRKADGIFKNLKEAVEYIEKKYFKTEC